MTSRCLVSIELSALLVCFSAATLAGDNAFERMHLQAYRGILFDAGAAYRDADYAKAFAGFQRAACAGDKASQENVGRMFALGQGTTRDDERAYAWLTTAGESGLTEYKALAKRLEDTMTPEQRASASMASERLLAEYGTRATRMSCLKSDSQGGRMSDTVVCKPEAVGGGLLLVHRCLDQTTGASP